MGMFGAGQPVPRTEDPRLLTGRGRYTADISLPGEVHAVFLRSPHAHAEIVGIDVLAAREVPGVLAVYTGADVAADGLGDIPCLIDVSGRDGKRLPSPGRPLIAHDRVLFVGDTVAMIVAETRAAALDSVDSVFVDYEPRPAAATIDDAIADGAPQLWDGASGNRAYFWRNGDHEATDEAFQKADRVVSLDMVNNRVAACPMEPRAVVGTFEDGRYTLFTPSQGAHLIQRMIAQHTLSVPKDSVRVIVPDVGGAFGAKIYHYAEEALVLWASRRLERPVKWVADRSDSFIADVHGRDHKVHADVALDPDGRMLGLRAHWYANMGAYLNCFGPFVSSETVGRMLTGAYAIPAMSAVAEGVYTNSVPVDAYRGAGRPEAAYLIERVIDAAAREIGLPVDEMRRRNLIRAEQMPFATAAGRTYDSGDFLRNMEDAMAAAEWPGFEARRAEARARGRLRGIGLSVYVEACGGGAAEEAMLRIDAAGDVELLIGTQSGGHGHETAYAQLVADGLDVPIDRIRVVQGDTDRIPYGGGTGGSRSLPVGGPAVLEAVDAVIARGKALAARLLQSAENDILFMDGLFLVSGTERGIGLADLAAAAAEPENRPADDAPPGLGATTRYAPDAATYPNGCHVCEVEIDPETGQAAIVNYRAVDDFGMVVNPLLLAGQVHGGVVQGIGQALLEEAVYDRETGQLLTGTFLDYALPRAGDVPAIEVTYNNVPCTTNPMGIKGAGEAGTIAACPAVMNAVIDALSPLGVRQLDMPATAEKIWRAIRAAPIPL